MVRKPPRERLLDAADAVLFIDGSFATPVDRILQEAGVAPATMYAHFGSKDGLVAAALWRRLNVWTQDWTDAIELAVTPTDRLLAVFPAMRAYQDNHVAERWCAFHCTRAAIHHPSAPIAEALDREHTERVERFHALAAALCPERGDALANAIEIVYLGVLADMLTDDPHLAIDRGEAAARTILNAYAPASFVGV